MLKHKLVRLGRWLEQQRPGATWRACVDTAPVLEREWAARAGLGWIGKNTSLLNRRLGSELFLGLLLTDLELEPDSPVPDHCGRCTACLDACPTRAFPEPRRARRSPLHRLPHDRAPRTGAGRAPRRPWATMVAGCDICQEVCPWTVQAPAGLHREFEPAPHRLRPLLDDLEALDEEGFRSWRQGSALNRIPFSQFRRNLAVARVNLERSED